MFIDHRRKSTATDEKLGRVGAIEPQSESQSQRVMTWFVDCYKQEFSQTARSGAKMTSRFSLEKRMSPPSVQTTTASAGAG